MNTVKEYINAIKEQIGLSNLREAIDLLTEMTNKFQLYKISTEIPLLKRRLNELSDLGIRGVASFEEMSRLRNQLSSSIMQVLESYEQDKLVEPLGTLREKGRIVHNIPPKMRIQQERYCSVRIAKNDQILLEGFDLPDENRPENVEISKTMEVTLVDPSGGKAFAIRMISPVAVQSIVEHTFTEWDFGITPLESGRQLLIMYAHFIDKIDDKETRRTLSFKKAIEITAENFEESPTVWQPTDIVISGEKEQKGAGYAGSKSNKWSSTAMLALIGGIILASLGYMAYKYMQPPPPPMPKEKQMIKENQGKVVPILLLDKTYDVESVFVTGRLVSNWSYNADSTAIILPEMAPGKYNFIVKGEKGICAQLFSLTHTENQVKLNCRTSNAVSPGNTAPVPQSGNLVAVEVITAVKQPIISVDGYIIQPQKVVPFGISTKVYLKLSQGNHTFSVADRSQRYICTDKVVNINAPNMSVVMDCDRNPGMPDSSLIIVKLFGSGVFYQIPSTYVKVNGAIVNSNLVKMRQAGKHLQIVLPKMAEGNTYEIAVGNHKSNSPECVKPITLSKQNIIVELNCPFDFPPIIN